MQVMAAIKWYYDCTSEEAAEIYNELTSTQKIILELMYTEWIRGSDH